MNHMEQIAEMLGVELGEEFRVSTYGRIRRLTEKGMEWYDADENIWEYNVLDFMLLCAGKLEIDKIPNILTKKEKILLRKVIQPYRRRLSMILKLKKRKDYEFILIGLIGEGNEHLELPEFKNGAKFSGMELQKGYSMEELGL